VRGSHIQCSHNLLQNQIHRLQHIIIPETQHTIPRTLQPFGTPRILLRALGMLTTVQFDNQTGIGADEIRDVRADFMLPPKFPSQQLAVAQLSPECAFGIGLARAQGACEVDVRAFHGVTFGES
jgi:hypothetical protein